MRTRHARIEAQRKLCHVGTGAEIVAVSHKHHRARISVGRQVAERVTKRSADFLCQQVQWRAVNEHDRHCVPVLNANTA